MLLRELVNPNNALLTDTQKAVLLITNMSSSGKMAYDNTTASKNLATSVNTLNTLGMIQLGDNEVQITDLGKNMLTYHNLIGADGELTDDGKNIMDSTKAVSKSFVTQAANEGFKFLATLL